MILVPSSRRLEPILSARWRETGEHLSAPKLCFMEIQKENVLPAGGKEDVRAFLATARMGGRSRYQLGQAVTQSKE